MRPPPFHTPSWLWQPAKRSFVGGFFRLAAIYGRFGGSAASWLQSPTTPGPTFFLGTAADLRTGTEMAALLAAALTAVIVLKWSAFSQTFGGHQ